jgi:autotransporter-associated beta strand protein
VVTNSADGGLGSLRQAILDIAGAPGLTHTVDFELPSGPQVINLLSALPAVTDPLIVVLDATQNVTVNGPSGTASDSYSTITKTGDGTLTLSDIQNFSGNVQVSSGALRLSEPTTPTFAPSVSAAVTGTGTLELDGVASALTRGVNVANSSTATGGILVSGQNQSAGHISGTGNTAVAAGASLIANSISQGALIIGGTATSPAIVTLATSDVSGNPLAAAAEASIGGASGVGAATSTDQLAPAVALLTRITYGGQRSAVSDSRTPADLSLADSMIPATHGADAGPAPVRQNMQNDLPDPADVSPSAKPPRPQVVAASYDIVNPITRAALDQILAEDYAPGGLSDSVLRLLADELMLLV